MTSVYLKKAIEGGMEKIGFYVVEKYPRDRSSLGKIEGACHRQQKAHVTPCNRGNDDLICVFLSDL